MLRQQTMRQARVFGLHVMGNDVIITQHISKRKERYMLDALLMIVSAMLIILSLLQSGKTSGMSGALTGAGGLNLFANQKERGSEKIISNMTLGLGIAFFVLVILIRVI